MIIKPYSAAREHGPGGIWDTSTPAAIAANFPSCKLFLKCAETSGTSLVDAVSGQAISVSSLVTPDTANAVKLSGTGVSAALPTPIAIGTKAALMITVMNSGAFSKYALNNTADAAIFSISTYLGNTVSDATNTANASNAAASAITGSSVYVASGAPNTAFKQEATLTTLPAATSASGAPGSIASIPTCTELQLISLSTTSQLYALMVFVFAGALPADIKSIVSWVTAQCQAGNKRLPPQLKGVA